MTDPSGRCLCTVRVTRQVEPQLAAQDESMRVVATVRLARACCVSSTRLLASVRATCATMHAQICRVVTV